MELLGRAQHRAVRHEGTGASEGAEAVQPEEDGLRGDLIVVCEYLKGGVMTREPALSQWCSVTGQGPKAKE